MDNHNQVYNFFDICGIERVCNDFIFTDNITLVTNELLKIQFDTIKLLNMKYLQYLNYIKRTQTKVRKSHTQQVEELNKKVEEITRAMEMLLLKTE